MTQQNVLGICLASIRNLGLEWLLRGTVVILIALSTNEVLAHETAKAMFYARLAPGAVSERVRFGLIPDGLGNLQNFKTDAWLGSNKCGLRGG
jgi:hypothetical protein